MTKEIQIAYLKDEGWIIGSKPTKQTNTKEVLYLETPCIINDQGFIPYLAFTDDTIAQFNVADLIGGAVYPAKAELAQVYISMMHPSQIQVPESPKIVLQ